ncbi:MAG: mannitol-1-phosphate 5-dehydrogenase [Bacteroidia bacterium]|nr:mannitol-1-phosphate 5-dehydrogenase [Bacteroidia bacterium]
MNPIKNRSQIDFRKIVIFGAGKIGRSFIGQLFGSGGYKVIFVDINPEIVSRLNKQGSYKVITKGEKDEGITVRNVQAILASDLKKIAEAVSTAGILAVSVGKNAIEKVIPLIASGLKIRYIQNPNQPLDIIIAENMIAAADFMKGRLIKNLPADYPFNDLIGLIETSIGKMVPIMTQVELEKDPLMVYSEPYNTLILDGKAFKTPVPEIKGLTPKNNIKAWVDRKAFIHNLGHATAAYYGVYRHPSSVFMYEILDDSEVLQFTRDVMLQSADILKDAYPNDFTINELEEHIDDLLHRFRNKSLGDTILRVGHDLTRKLNRDDRFMGAIHLAGKFNKPYDKILKAMSYGLFFRAKDNEGNLFQSDVKFLNALSAELKKTFVNYLNFDPEEDRIVIEKLKDLYETLRNDTVNQ